MQNSDRSEDLRASEVARATIIGGGVIGASWAALFLANGVAVTINDPDPDIAGKAKKIVEGAVPALSGLGYRTDGLADRLDFESDLAAAVASADLVQECGPEKVDFNQLARHPLGDQRPVPVLPPRRHRRRHGPFRRTSRQGRHGEAVGDVRSFPLGAWTPS